MVMVMMMVTVELMTGGDGARWLCESGYTSLNREVLGSKPIRRRFEFTTRCLKSLGKWIAVGVKTKEEGGIVPSATAYPQSVHD